MTKEEFLEKLKSTLCTNENLTEQTELHSLDEWDSIGVMSVVSMIEDDFGISLDYSETDNLKTVQDLMAKVQIK